MYQPTFNNEIMELLVKEGCDIMGFADLRHLPQNMRVGYDFGVVIGLVYSKEAMEDNKNQMPQKHYDETLVIDKRLPEMAGMVVDFLTNKGYDSIIATKEIMPHKTAATLAGIGWWANVRPW